MEAENTGTESSEIRVAELAPKTTLGKALAFLSDKFLKPSVITVFVTALLGPLAVQWVNDSLENKKLQEKVISTVLNYTSEADFSKPESIEKIGIIAQMVDENEAVFGLSFRKTNETINQLNDATNNVGIKNLDKKLKEAEVNINDFSGKIAGDSILLNNLILQREQLVTQIDKASKANNQIKKNQIDQQLAKLDLDLKELERNSIFNTERLKYWTEQKVRLTQDISDAQKDLANVLKKNRDKETMLNQEKEQLKLELAKTLSDINLLTAKIQELEANAQTLRDSIRIYKITK